MRVKVTLHTEHVGVWSAELVAVVLLVGVRAGIAVTGAAWFRGAM